MENRPVLQEERLDVKTIMDEIRREIKEKGLVDDLPSFDQVSMGKYNHNASLNGNIPASQVRMNQCWRIIPDDPIPGSGTKAILKKTVRKLTRFLRVSMAEKITVYNQNTTETINQLTNAILYQERKINELTKYVDELRAAIGAEIIRREIEGDEGGSGSADNCARGCRQQ